LTHLAQKLVSLNPYFCHAGHISTDFAATRTAANRKTDTRPAYSETRSTVCIIQDVLWRISAVEWKTSLLHSDRQRHPFCRARPCLLRH